jgi:hypothetical protein
MAVAPDGAGGAGGCDDGFVGVDDEHPTSAAARIAAAAA